METPRRSRTICGGGGAPLLLFVAVIAAISVLYVPLVSADAFYVGDKQHWAPNVNYTPWAAKHRIHVGDWLVFLYRTGGLYDVMEVNATDYEKCSPEHPILNYSRGHSFAMQLNESRWYYFICSRGYCWNGMKLAIHVEDLPPVPAPAPHASAAAPAGGSLLHRFVISAAAIALLLLACF